MRSIRIGLGLMATLALSIAVTASASAASFLATTKEKLLSTKVETQLFSTENGTFECTEANIVGGESSTTEVTTQLALVEYGHCTSFAFIEMKLSLADYSYLAGGTVALDKLIKVTTPSTGCEMSFPVQTFGAMEYDNSGRNIKLLPHVTGLHYTASGCAHNGSFANGTTAGSSEIMVANGTLSFMP